MAKFKTRARAVDMLGRQQIAGIPNAISELFKNAHDAYADRVEIDYFRSDGLFVLRDDGLGMTKVDFEERWLTLGTESKLVGQKGIKSPPIDSNKKRRPITGEKGIGRLAIAVIGPQVLVLTRAKRGENLHDLVAAFLHWGLFEAPGINLEQIEIPIRVFPGGTLPNQNEIKELIDTVRMNTLQLEKQGEIEPDFSKRIQRDLDRFDPDLIKTAEFLGKPNLLEKGYGTHFYILPASENLSADLDIDLQGQSISRLRKLLLGFGNTLTPNSEQLIATAFRYWSTDEYSTDIISDREFFNPEDLDLADHHIEGAFDEYGQFTGTVSVYGEPIRHVIPWPQARGRQVSCGPFRINVAYVPGLKRESKIPPEEYARLTQKLDRIGGLYIYQDGIRVLPYGDSDVDFLEIEKRRSLGAAYYFFSYRRMFGAIELTREKNGQLAEKAGREGFQENKAYREFKAILINFFVQLAADFFREGGSYAEVWTEAKTELNRLDAAIKKQAKQSLAKRRAFSTALESFFTRVEKGEPDIDLKDIVASLEQRIKSLEKKGDGFGLIEAEVAVTKQIANIRQAYRVERPRGIGLNKQLKRDWQAYSKEWERLEQELFAPIEKKVGEMITQASQQMNFALNERQRVDLLLNEVIVASRTQTQAKIKDVQKALTALQEKFASLSQQITWDMRNTASVVEAEFNRSTVFDQSRHAVELIRHQWENRILSESQRVNEVLAYLLAQIENINWLRDEEGHLIGDAEITSALEEEVLALREKAEVDLELTQLGMAIEVINHEFGQTIRSIRENLRQLKKWADINPKLQLLYNELRANFEHLDGYLTLFTPLHKRLYRQAIDFTGADILDYLERLFKERMSRHQIRLISSQSFRDTKIKGYPSTIYPVFVNLVDNSIFWLKDQAQFRQISLDTNEEGFVISDTGPGIPKRDRDAIFEMGFTRKPGGRGLGLYISREVLKREGFGLELDESDEGKKGAVFVLLFPQKS